MSHLNTAFEPEFDTLLDLDQTSFTPNSGSPAQSKASSSQRPSFASSSSSTFGSNQPQRFSGPSFQYGAHRQQTGLPVGGLANTFAVNQAIGLQYNGSHNGFVMPTETLNIPLSNLDEFDFARTSSIDMGDMDFDDDSPADLPTMFYPSSSETQFVNPNALVSQDDSPVYPAPVQRMYPGIHSQQAAQAKAQQVLKQQEALRQQQTRQIPGQQPLPSPPKSSQAAKDSHVEESISRLLNQMRHNSVASADDAASSPTGDMPHLARLKKEEDDMDEDERLLASEEGKKLSSKERRQLRNKVSARAFRSRRKEYIGQLEGEVAVKAQEANDLRTQNRQLMEENRRLTDLTRMLLSSQAFSSFLTELSNSGMPATGVAHNQSQSQTQAPAQSQPQPQPTRKDINPHQAVRQMQNTQPQVNMVLLPESAVDFSTLETSTNSWNTVPMNDFHVFSVTSLPEAPSIDPHVLAGKAPASSSSSNVTAEAKDVPRLSNPPDSSKSDFVFSQETVNPHVMLDEEKFALYFQPRTAPRIKSTVQAPTPHCSHSPTEAEAEAAFKQACSLIDISCDRLATFTSHMSGRDDVWHQ